ncbi:rod shape-determining protein MreC, partial [gut metagenome]
MIVLCVISLLLLTFYLREGDVGPIHSLRGGVMTVTAPVRMLGSAVAAPFNALGNLARNATASSQTLTELEKENERLTAKVAELSEAEQTASRLEKLVGLKSTYSLESSAARIIGSAGSAWSNAVVIDKGSSSGFEVGMP